MTRVKTFLNHPLFFRVCGVVYGLFVVAAAGHWLALFVFEISCETHGSLPYEIAFVAYEALGIVVTALTLLQVIGWLWTRRFKRALLLTILFAAVALLGLRLFGEMAFYCFGEALIEALRVPVGMLFEMLRTILTPK